ncbi:MAG TPA: hypothetical protein DD490_28655, partial [Acidobacteria bacterium]|nr:hypothetical protein [Acidobacteriota bacterium]
MSRLAAKIFATLTGNLFLAVGSLLLGTLAILGSWVPPRGTWVFVMARLWSVLALRASLLRVEVRKEVEIDPGKSFVFLANRQSLFDIPLL